MRTRIDETTIVCPGDAEINGKRLIDILYQEICVDCVYENDLVSPKDCDVVVDIGANIGLFSMRAAELGAKTIIAFEPDFANFQSLVKNKPINCLAYQLAVSDKDGKDYYYETTNCGGHSIIDLDRGDIKHKCYHVTLPMIFRSQSIGRINFLKMDCEGAEAKIFTATPDDYLKRIDQIAMEYHHELIPDFPYGPFLDRLRKHFEVRTEPAGAQVMIYAKRLK